MQIVCQPPWSVHLFLPENGDSGSLTHQKIALRNHYRRFFASIGPVLMSVLPQFPPLGEGAFFPSPFPKGRGEGWGLPVKAVLLSCAGFVIRHDRVRGFQPRADCKSAPPIRRDFKSRRTKQQIVATALTFALLSCAGFAIRHDRVRGFQPNYSLCIGYCLPSMMLMMVLTSLTSTVPLPLMSAAGRGRIVCEQTIATGDIVVAISIEMLQFCGKDTNNFGLNQI